MHPANTEEDRLLDAYDMNDDVDLAEEKPKVPFMLAEETKEATPRRGEEDTHENQMENIAIDDENGDDETVGLSYRVLQ
jgi:hypothetical protein